MSDLFDFFKENESKLQENPSAKVWKKLEVKLERKRRRNRQGIRFLQLGLVVVLLLLLLLLGFWAVRHWA